MTLIFGIVFFILAKFGFPAITGMVDKRSAHIEESLRKAEEAQKSLGALADEQKQLLEQTKLEQGRLIKEATEARDKIVAGAKRDAADEAAKIIAHAKAEIEAQRQSALRDLSSQVAALSLKVAEKIIRQDLASSTAQTALADKLAKEVSEIKPNNS